MLRHVLFLSLFPVLSCVPLAAIAEDGVDDPFEQAPAAQPPAERDVSADPDEALVPAAGVTEPEDAQEAADESEPEVDPWEGFNRKIFAFNEKFDRYIFKPTAKGYRKVTPDWLDDSITRFFENLSDLRSGLNNVLQWEWGNAGNNFGRFGVNTTLGVAGLFDVASDMNLRKVEDDLSATLAVWGVPQGPYLVLPILGPSSVRDASTLWPEDYMRARHYIDHDLTRWSVTAVYAIDLRADLLDLEKAIVGDRYSFIRDAWLAQRRQIISPGAPPEDDFGSGFDDFEDEEW